jgi:PAS domain S-box-containing protein
MVEGVRDYALFMLDPEGRVTTWNEGAQHTMGYEAREIIGEHFSIFYTEEDTGRGHPESELRVAATKGRFEEEGIRVGKGGSRLWAHVVITALKDESGNLCGFSQVTRDITERKQAEEALKTSETKYRMLVEQTPAITYVQEPIESSNSKAVTYVSPQYETILGYPADSEVIDEEHWLRTIHPEDKERVLAEEARTDQSGEPFKVEYRVIAEDGRVVWLRDEATLVRDEEGYPLYWLGVQYDVTEQKRAENALTASEIRYRTLVEQMPAITYIEAVDREERRTDLLYASPQIEAMFGYSPEEWMADPHLFEKLLHPDDREWVLAEDARTDETGEPFSVEYRQFTRDGRIIWISDEAVLVKDEEGRPLYWQGVMHDITDQKRTEDALRQSEELYRSVVEQAAENIFLVDVGTKRILEANAALHRSLGYSTEELRQLTLYDIVAHDRESVDCNVRRVVEEVHHFIGERHYRRKDGSLIDVEVSAGVISYGGGRALCVVAHDVTERKKAEKELRELVGRTMTAQEEERRRVAYDIHDGFTQMAAAAYRHLTTFMVHRLPETAQDQQELEDAVALVQRTVSEARRIIANLRPTTLDDFGLATAIRMQVEELRSEGFDASYEETLGEERLPAMLETALFRVVQEALTNVRKHAQTDRIRVVLGRHDGFVRLEVRDWGRGFELAEVGEGGGPGERVGLSSMRERVALLGGSLKIRSEPEVGTEVVAEVPLPTAGEEIDGGA